MTDDPPAQGKPESTVQGAGWTPLHDAAVALHESFLAYVAAGFTEDQALSLMAKMLTERNRE